MSGNWDESARVPPQQLDADTILRTLLAHEMPVPFTPDGLDEGGNWALRTRAGRVDVLQWIPGIDGGYEQLRANAIEDDVPGIGRVAFAGYEDLVKMKRTAGRPQDAADLHELEQVRRDPE